ncbi:NYN domain-containing protein [Dehalobacter restrictus]|uniref:NYN domain-containing protein n=1 Tax=Dehalobacter restrictus TaxID=55583 RepID=UPI00338F0AC0
MMSTDGVRAPRSIINGLDIRGILEEILADNNPSEILWFGAKLRIYDNNEEIKQKSQAAVHIQSAFMNFIQKQKIQFIKVGYLRARESEPCVNCNEKVWRLAEKGVDVGLAVRMLTEANETTELVIITSDTDLVPAFRAAKKNGASLMHIGYENRPITALSRISDKTRTITLPLINKYNSRLL